MTLQITAQTFHLRHLADDDRLLLSVDLSAEHELGMMLTRRLTRNLLTALANLVASRSAENIARNPVLRDTILDAQHAQSVANAVADGSVRNRVEQKALAVPAKLVGEIKVVPREGGGISLVFMDGAQNLAVDVAPERIHMVIETFLRAAESAQWDFPVIASWLDKSKSEPLNAANRIVH